MKFLAISGSNRAQSTNTAMLHSVAQILRPLHHITVYHDIATLPVFSPDAEAMPLPRNVQSFVDAIRDHDGLIISSPEYVRAIPGGLKNAIDWLVSRDEIIAKPIALLHASHRGDDMLTQLRLVLSTVSDQFHSDLFLRFSLMNMSPHDISRTLMEQPSKSEIIELIQTLAQRCPVKDRHVEPSS